MSDYLAGSCRIWILNEKSYYFSGFKMIFAVPDFKTRKQDALAYVQEGILTPPNDSFDFY